MTRMLVWSVQKIGFHVFYYVRLIDKCVFIYLEWTDAFLTARVNIAMWKDYALGSGRKSIY
jgi:hypothetical protein